MNGRWKCVVVVVAAVQLLSSAALAQDAAVAVAAQAPEVQEEVHIPITAGLLPGLSFNGLDAGRVVNNFSLGLLATHAGRVDGMALSPALNVVERGVRGLELAGAANTASDLVGAQLAGALNVATGDATGWQVAGALNVAAGEVRAWQLAGAVNVAGAMRGLQVSAATNVAERLSGVQLSVVNIGGDVEGAQIGVVNIARKVSGLQLGVVNVSSELYGMPIGLVSVAGNGMFHLQAWASDVSPTHLSLKFGGRRFYSLVTVGYELQRPGEERRWLTGLGLGGHLPLDRFYLDVDATAYNAKRSFVGRSEDAILSQLRAVGGYQLARHLSVFAGVTGNVLVDWNERDWDDVGLGLTHEAGGARSRVTLWPGLVAGVQL